MFYPTKKALKIFETLDQDSLNFDPSESLNQIAGDTKPKGLETPQLPQLGQEIGFLKRLSHPQVISVFVTKGGVLKTTLTLNLARMAALHNIRTLVIGLDMQCDITTALGLDLSSEDDSLTSAMNEMDRVQGLADFFFDRTSLQNIILPTDLPSLFMIPETPELVAVEQSLLHRAKRELWLKEKVIEPLKDQFDLFVLDCSPNWNQLITNALTASDVLLSPLECKINNYRNFQMFRNFIEEFKEEMNLKFSHVYVPTRLTAARKLSKEIRDWYVSQISNCVPVAIRDSVAGEEATAMNISVPEYQPGSEAAREMNQVMEWVWQKLQTESGKETQKRRSADHGPFAEPS